MENASINRLDLIWDRLSRCAKWSKFVCDEDRKTYHRRACSEGDEFRTRSLATIGGLLLQGLETGALALPAGESRFGRKRNSKLPRFLHGAWAAIFCEENACLRAVPDAQAVACIRQLTTVFSKLPGSYRVEAESEVIERFKATETEISATPLDQLLTRRTRDGCYAHQIAYTAKQWISRALMGFNPREITPGHGSGASACRTAPWKRYSDFRFDSQIDAIWPYSEFFFASPTALVDDLERLTGADTLVRDARVVLVPKDYRGPRLISCEPRELMYIQQGLMFALYEHLETHPNPARGYVNFTNQLINRRLADIGSRDGTYATLDLKDASDRVRMDLVERLFPDYMTEVLHAARSTRTILPNGEAVELSKHAPMGSSLCFPIMALTIWGLIKAYYSTASDTVHEKVYVYGDDIVVPSRLADEVCDVLEMFDLSVNRRKSFSAGSFRESCGGEYFNGVDVTPIKLKTRCYDTPTDQLKTVAFANNIRLRYGDDICGLPSLIHSWWKGIGETTRRSNATVDEVPEWFKPPPGSSTAGFAEESETLRPFVLLVHQADNTSLRRRWNPKLLRFEYRILCCRPVYDFVNMDGWGYVLRALLRRGDVFLGARGLCAKANRVRHKLSWRAID